MNETNDPKNHGEGKGDEPQTGPNVTIYVNDTPIQIHRGSRTIQEIKIAGGVPLADQLQLQKPGGGLEKLDQDGRFTIHGSEHFVSFPTQGGSS